MATDGAVQQDALGARLGYRPALDGLRAFAIGVVVPYHWIGVTGSVGIAGGFLGVNLFFVLSGYLITRLLVEEHAATGRIGRAHFYRRRFARLMPAYFTLLATVVVVARIIPAFASAEAVRVGASSSILYVTNWVAAARGFGILGPFAHLWSLTIEEQFYVLWPLALVLLLRRMSPRAAARVAFGAAAVIFLQIGVRSYFNAHDIALYVATDGQAMAFLLVGCATALTFPLGDAFVATPFGRFVRRVGAWAVLPIVPFVVAFDHDQLPFYFRGGLVLIAACMVVLLLAALTDSPFSRALGAPPLVWLGQRSYSVYLWHYPVIFLVNWMNKSYAMHWRLSVEVLIAAVLTIAVAEASFRYVERPLRRRLAGSPYVIASMRSSATRAPSAVSGSTTI